MRAGRYGSVLILSVWALFFLGALALAVGSYVSANLSLAGGLSKDLAGSHLARAGIERAIAELACDTNQWDAFTENWADPELFEQSSLPSGEFSVSHRTVSGSGTVSTVQAMDQNRLPLRVRDNLEKTNDLFPFGMPGLHIDMLIGQTQFTDLVTVRMERSQIDDRFNTHLLEACHSFRLGLSAAIQIVAHLMHVRHSCKLYWCGPCRLVDRLFL